MHLTAHEAQVVLKIYSSGTHNDIPGLDDLIDVITGELAEPLPRREDDPNAVFINMGHVGFISSESYAHAMKTVGLGSCLFCVSYSTPPTSNLDWYGSAAHCAMGLNTDDMVQKIVKGHDKMGVPKDAITFEIYATGAVDPNLITEIQASVKRYTGQDIPEKCIVIRTVHTGCFLYDFRQKQAYEFPGLDMSYPFSTQHNIKSIPLSGSPYEIEYDERLLFSLQRNALLGNNYKYNNNNNNG